MIKAKEHVFHHVDSRRPLNVLLVGAGGTGSQMLSGLIRMHLALKAKGHLGFNVIAMDGDVVTESNVGRQLFYPGDVGHNKAQVLIHRANLCFGLGWKAISEMLGMTSNVSNIDILISCVDTKSARVLIHDLMSTSRRPCYWIDTGNRANDGQVVFGQVGTGAQLKNVLEHFPAMKDGQEDHDTPSCSLAEALNKQDLFINQAVATSALNMLWQAFNTGVVQHGVTYINLKQNKVLPECVS